MVVWTIVNVEDWGIERPMPRTVLPPPMGQPLLPDLPNWAWHEYGMRVGFWRLLDCLGRFNVAATCAINGIVCRTYPRIAQAARDAGWEFMGHGYVQRPMHHLEDERQAIRETIAAIRAFTGRAPRGWESPGLAETYGTIDVLAEEGIEYVADWVLDDQPCRITTSTRPDRLDPVHRRNERYSDDADPAPFRRRGAAARDRSVRAALHGERRQSRG